MSLSTIYTRAPDATSPSLIRVEVHLASGLPSLTLVGLPEKSVKESKDRVRAAIQNSGFDFPTKRITINLSPADLPKEGARYDLAIALGILAASNQIPSEQLDQFEWHGELALSGEIRAVNGVLPCAYATYKAGKSIFVPLENIQEALLIQEKNIYSAQSLQEITAILHQQNQWKSISKESIPASENTQDFNEVIGQYEAKRALFIAAAGGHHVLMNGPPGTGKSMLAKRFASILPKMTKKEAIESASIHSVSQEVFHFSTWGERPFRSPHHSSSATALVGGGSIPKPGEISLAHYGVLFLDELPEFDRKVLEMLREPIENGGIHISRSAMKTFFPSRFQLIAAMNPCPCGFYGDSQQACKDTPDQINRYRQKISGPLLDRIDIHLSVNRMLPHQLRKNKTINESSKQIKDKVDRAYEIQIKRQGKQNAFLNPTDLKEYLNIQPESLALLDQATEKMHFSMRTYHRLLKVAQTIADIEHSNQICPTHIAEALQYRGWNAH